MPNLRKTIVIALLASACMAACLPASAAAQRRSRAVEEREQRMRQYEPHIAEAAELYQLPLPLLLAIVRVESNFNPEVVSRRGARGLMQLMPITARAMGVQNPGDPRESVLGGARCLRYLANRFNGNIRLTIAAYNAGEGAVARRRISSTTRRYVQLVMRYYREYCRARNCEPLNRLELIALR